jgi:NTP pyrophosphatase (non-canonical NTP hydrolase)
MSVMRSDAKVSVYDLKSVLKRFRDQRNWQQFHDPKNLAEAIAIEASELLELFLWKSPTEIEVAIKKGKTFQRDIENELADVFCFSFNLANALDLDVSSIVQRKIKENGKKYPISQSRGTATKYTKLQKGKRARK